ncbi:MAG: hypothetical protein ABIG46_08010 [Candidatus Omnitrophota bacterium]
MNKEEYANMLMKKSKYCNCPQLSEISKIGEESRKLEKICEDFNASLDLENPKMKDLDNLLDYSRRHLRPHLISTWCEANLAPVPCSKMAPVSWIM